MKRLIAGWLTFVAIAAGLPAAAQAQDGGSKVYRWTDENGVVHFGDRVPPQYAQQDRDILNQQGVPVKHEEGAITEEEKHAAEAARAAAEAERERLATQRARDDILLTTYLSVDEIESLRDQRAELIDGQIRLTEKYLASLREKLKKLQQDASRFRPYSPDPEAPPIHENLARELSDTLDSIILYEQNLEMAKARKAQLIQKFAADINRFKELKGIE